MLEEKRLRRQQCHGNTWTRNQIDKWNDVVVKKMNKHEDGYGANRVVTMVRRERVIK
jgi:hypothetical protein